MRPGSGLAFILLLLGCGHASVHKHGELLLRVDGPEAVVFLDDRPVPVRPGKVATRLRLPSGLHRIEVRAPGHFTAYREVAVPEDGQRQVVVPLRADPDAPGE